MNAARVIVNDLLEDEAEDAQRYMAELPEPQVGLRSPIAPGDGVTAPCRIVLHRAAHDTSQWVTHMENMQVGGYMFGSYFGKDYPAALENYQYRCKKLRVDPAKSEPFRESEVTEAKAPKMKVLKDNRVELEPSERKEVMRRKAVWHHGPGGKESPAVWKSVVRGKTYFVCNTHRAAAVKPTLKAAIRSFDFIKTTA